MKKSRANNNPINRATRISNLYELAKGEKVWRQGIARRALNMIKEDPKTGIYLRRELTQALLENKFITVNFTRDEPVQLTDAGTNFLNTRL